MAKVICNVTVGAEQVLANITTVAGIVPLFVGTTPGVGQPFWYWPSIPVGKVVACDFSLAPLASADRAVNLASMNAITATPQSVLTYDPPLAP